MELSRKLLEHLKVQNCTIQIQRKSYHKSSWQCEQKLTPELIDNILEEQPEITFLRVKIPVSA